VSPEPIALSADEEQLFFKDNGPVVAHKGSNFALAFLFLPRGKREALGAVYAYCRHIDDIVDSGRLGPAEARRMLDFWRAEVERLYLGAPTHVLSRDLLPHVQAFRLPKEAFLDMIRGCAMDLERARYETPESLESYMQGVASSVGVLCVEIFGYSHSPPDRMRRFADLFGYAFQLTNIIRDVGADLELGRIYIPASDMKASGYTEQALLRREPNEAFARLMGILYQRAKGYYRQARACADVRDRPALLPAEIMAHVYEGLLEDIRAGGFRVLFHRQRLSAWRKTLLAAKAWFYCHGF